MDYIQWVDQYGYLVLFLSLMLELIALPIPTEILMSYVGYLTYQHHMNAILAVLIGALGSSTGMTVAYWIGYKLGYPFFHKYGSKFHLGPERLDKVSNSFEKHGKKLLLVAFFIPGVRHITSYFSGITRMPFKEYALFAYTGGLIWVSTFITLGNVLGPQWKEFHETAKKYLVFIVIALVILIGLFYLIKMNLHTVKETAIDFFFRTIQLFHSQLKLKILIGITGVVFVLLASLMIGLIQDYLDYEFGDFNAVTFVIIQSLFNREWSGVMGFLQSISAMNVMTFFMVLSYVWIALKGRHRLLEATFATVLFIGGNILKQVLAFIFNTLHITQGFNHDFPNQQTFYAIVVYGFLMYIVSRHAKGYHVKTLVPVVTLIMLFLNGVALIYAQLLPNAVAAGFVFGGVWLSLIITLLEVFRLLRFVND